MAEALLLPVSVDDADAISTRLHCGAGELSGRLARALGTDHPAHGFLAALAAAATQSVRPVARRQPIDVLAGVLGLSPLEIDLIVLAALPEEHEGLAAMLRGLHPVNRPVATAGLAAALAEAGLLPGLPAGTAGRHAVRRELGSGVLARAAALNLPAGPFWERDLVLADGLWAALHDEPSWPAGCAELPHEPAAAGAIASAGDAVRAVLRGAAVVATVLGADAETAALRAAPLLARHGLRPVVLRVTAEALAPAWLAAVARELTAVFVTDADPVAVPDVPAPFVLARADGSAPVTAARPVHAIDLPASGRSRSAHRPVPLGGVRVVPSAGWDDLVLPDGALDQLREAVSRVRHGDTVLDHWGFLAGRPGRRGMRLLFCGPPGTGKTLAAEVLAGAVGRELLVVDLSRTVSKWIGETEKNLAAAFDAAERGDYVLLFDEADALFAKRTEVGDARDRYANLETSYLLSRLSWFDGVAVLATNLRQNLDVAFGRRLEFVVPFDLPDPPARRALWRAHLPAGAPLDPGVELDQLADFYPLSGALIRNAAIGAAYLAAGAGASIGPDQLAHAIHREYVKAGLAYPGPLPQPSGN